MTAEEYVVKKVQEQEEDIRLMEGHIEALRNTVRENIDDITFLLSLIEEGRSYNGMPVYEFRVTEQYDKETFDKLKAVKERSIF